jgi:hypothetical protein
MKKDQRIKICKRTREYSQKSFFNILQKILDNNLNPSETEIRDMWIFELRKNDAVLKDGWYLPPPHGIGILIGTDNDGQNSRLNYKSLRPQEIWPRNDIKLNRENGIIYAYSSPIDKKTGIIGDFGITLYFGKKKKEYPFHYGRFQRNRNRDTKQ